MPNSLIARYDRKEKNLFVRCVSPNHCLIGLEIDNPQEKELNSLVSGYFILSSQNSQYWLCENCSQIFITNFDTINCIVSGTFEFLGKCAYISQGHVDTLTNVYCSEESTVRVTDGRFDIKLDIY